MSIAFSSSAIPKRVHQASTRSFWSTDDTEYKWKRNVKAGVMIEKYLSPEAITYNYNSLGYRSDNELSDFSDDSYIASFGCSMTEGVGLNYTDTYCHLLGEELNLGTMNFGVAGGSMHLVDAQILQYVKLILAGELPKPSLVTVQWPSPYRYTFVRKPVDPYYAPSMYEMFLHNPNFPIPDGEPTCTHLDQKWLVQRYATYPEHEQVETYKMIERSNFLLDTICARVINFTLSGDQNDNPLLNHDKIHDIPFHPGSGELPLARDLAHPGSEVQQQYANIIKGLY